jgi:GGDEF domain-containing protein
MGLPAAVLACWYFKGWPMGDTHSDPHRPADAPLDAPAAARLARAARAAEELCATLWEAMGEELAPREELRRPRARRVGELAERLVQICSVIAALALEEQAPELEWPGPTREPEIAIHDTRREASHVPGAADGSASDGGALRAWAQPGGEGQPAWAQAIEASLERHAADGLPFAVLLVEVPSLERLAQAESSEELARMLEAVERAVGPELRPSDTLVRESPGRWWLTASRTNAPGARTLAERLARTLRTVASHRGVPLELAVGIAVCPVDGGDVVALATHADVGLYAARAAGRPVAPVDDAA